MDSFTAVVMVWAGTLVIAFFAGRHVPMADVVQTCTNKGEIVIQGKVLKCKPVAVMVDGKRMSIISE